MNRVGNSSKDNLESVESTHGTSFIKLLFHLHVIWSPTPFTAVVSALWAFLSSRHNSALYCMHCICVSLTVFTVLYLCWWIKYSFIFIHSFIHEEPPAVCWRTVPVHWSLQSIEVCALSTKKGNKKKKMALSTLRTRLNSPDLHQSSAKLRRRCSWLADTIITNEVINVKLPGISFFALLRPIFNRLHI